MRTAVMRERARHALDARTADWRRLAAAGARPHGGWIRAIREALGLSATDLADRLGVTQSTVSRIEASERNGRIQLDTLRRAADALDCELVYALVPRRGLDDLVHERARAQALEYLRRVGHTMELEAQGIGDAALRARLDELTEQLKRSPNLWREGGAKAPARPRRGLD